ncbi:MAG TPA: glycosyltransferase [Candidatus Acidoferrum sp.]|jgi:glycosyltransferase involved in cell wall biosynthesis
MTFLAKPKVIIFCDHLLYPSETFIHAQANALSEFEPMYAGSRRVAGLDLREEHIHLINQGNMWGKCCELCFKLTGFAPDFVKRLGALNPVLLHAHYGPNGLRALPIASNLKIPLIVTFHGFDVTATDLRGEKSYMGFRHYLANKWRLKRSRALFLAVSKFIRRKLLEQNFPEERVLVHYTGVDTKKFQPANTEESPLILFVGRLELTKGPEFVIRAAAEVQRQLPTVELVLIGEGSLRADLEKLAKQSLRRYRFLGVRTSDEVREWMNRASVVCVPSITRRSGEEEGFGMVSAEAQSVAKPVVAFDSGAISEVVSHGSTGFLAPERDWKTLAGYLIALLQSAELRKQFGLAGRECVVREFDLEQRTRVLEGIYAGELGGCIVPKEDELWPDSAINSYS